MHALDLAAAVARMQRRELYRDARARRRCRAPARRGADRVDRGLVARRSTARPAPPSPPPRPACRRNSGSPCAPTARPLSSASSIVWPATNCSPIRRMARFTPARISGSPPRADQPGQRRRQAALAAGRRQPAGQQQAPGRGIHEQRRAVAEMGLPVAAADLVADQRVARLVVGNAQQRLGQAHQRHALLARERIFVDQPFDAAATALRAQPLDQPPCQRRRAPAWSRPAGWPRRSEAAGIRARAAGRRTLIASRSGLLNGGEDMSLISC